MAATITLLLSLLILMVKVGDAQQVFLKLQNPRLMNCRFDKIYQFGDSLSDTGNCIRETLCGANLSCGALPYGMDFYQNATGRCSNGMLIIDFIAVESGLPLLNPYKDENADFRHGVNFAVAGCTTLSAKSLAKNNIVNIALTNSSLNVQLDWMSSHLQTTCSPGCPEKLNKSLFLVGEIGGNEFIYGLSQGKIMDDSRRMVPEIVQTVIHGVKVSYVQADRSKPCSDGLACNFHNGGFKFETTYIQRPSRLSSSHGICLILPPSTINCHGFLF